MRGWQLLFNSLLEWVIARENTKLQVIGKLEIKKDEAR